MRIALSLFLLSATTIACGDDETSSTTSTTAGSGANGGAGATGAGGAGATAGSASGGDAAGGEGTGGDAAGGAGVGGAGGAGECGAVGDACQDTCPDGLTCEQAPAGVCAEDVPGCGGIVPMPCPASHPVCLYFDSADFGMCATQEDAACICAKAPDVVDCP